MFTDGEFTPEMTAILCCAIFTAGIAFPNICSCLGKTKTVLVWSSSCMAISLGALGIYCHLLGTLGKIDDYKVAPLALLGLFYFCFAIGPHSFTWQYVQETIPVEHFFNIRNVLVAVSWSVIFAITRTLPRLIDIIGVGWLFWYMSLMCLFLTIFSAVIVPECKKLPEEKKLVYAGESSEGDVWKFSTRRLHVIFLIIIKRKTDSNSEQHFRVMLVCHFTIYRSNFNQSLFLVFKW